MHRDAVSLLSLQEICHRCRHLTARTVSSFVPFDTELAKTLTMGSPVSFLLFIDGQITVQLDFIVLHN